MKGRSNIIERLLAHAELCQKLAAEASHEDAAEGLRQMARECVEAARMDADQPVLPPVPSRIWKS